MSRQARSGRIDGLADGTAMLKSKRRLSYLNAVLIEEGLCK